MLRFASGLVLLLASPAFSQAGNWTLTGSEWNGQLNQDPRWTCSLNLSPKGGLALKSITVMEEHLAGPQGENMTRTRQDVVELQGTWKGEKAHLNLLLPRLDDSQKAFAELHFGAPVRPGVYRVPFRLQNALRLGPPRSTMIFKRL